MKTWEYGPWENCEVDGMPYLATAVMLRDIKPGMPAVYAIKWADGETYEYVGQTKCLRHRLLNHEHGFLNCRFEVLKWTDIEDLEDRLVIEGQWITKLIRRGHDLVNNCHYAKAARLHYNTTTTS